MAKYSIRMVLLSMTALLAATQVGHAKGLTLKQVQGLLSDLGYEAVDRGDGRLAIEDQGQFKNVIDFSVNDDQTLLNIYTPLNVIPDDKKDAIPAVALLKANDSIGPFTYAIVTADGKDRLDMEGYFDTSTVNKQMLRHTIDALIAAQDAGEGLWGVAHWTVAATPASPAPATSAAPAASPPPTSPAAPAASSGAPAK